MIRVKDLPDLVGLKDNTLPRPLLWCRRCGGEYSAHRGDYFAADPETAMRCGCSVGRPGLLLVVRRVTFTPWKPQ
jgi:hypothetical protein